jgi:Alginate export
VTRIVFMAITAASACAQTLGQPQTSLPAPPPYPQMTYGEDNRFLANPALRTEPLDVLKYIPLSATDTNSYLSFGAFIRERVEYVSNPDWGSGPPGSAYLMQRYLVHADLHLGERLRVFTELGSSLEDWRTGGPRSGLDRDRFDLHQEFVDLGLWQGDRSSLTLRAGRQEMAFGSGTLISTRDGRNIRVSFDGFRLSLLANEWTIDAFAVRQTKNKPGMFDDAPNSDLGLWGVYAVRPLKMLPGGHIDVYYLGNENKLATYDAGGTGYDGLYSPSNLIVTGQKSNASYIGNQTGAQLQWKLNRHVTFMMDYEHFFPGEFLTQSTAGRSVDYFTAWLDFRF